MNPALLVKQSLTGVAPEASSPGLLLTKQWACHFLNFGTDAKKQGFLLRDMLGAPGLCFLEVSKWIDLYKYDYEEHCHWFTRNNPRQSWGAAATGLRSGAPQWISVVTRASRSIDLNSCTHLRWDRLANTVKEDIEKLSPKTKVKLHPLDISNPWDFEETYSALYDFARGYKFKADKENYYMHITTGTHVAQICLFLLTESRHVPGKTLSKVLHHPKENPAVSPEPIP